MFEIIICKGFENSSLWECYRDEFGDIFPMFFGIGSGSYNNSKKLSETKNDTINSYHGLGYLSNSKSHYRFLHSPLMSLYYPDGSPIHLAVRQACFEWFYTIAKSDKTKERRIFDQIRSEYCRDYVWDKDKKCGKLILNRQRMQHVFHDLFFRYTLGIQLVNCELRYLDMYTGNGAAAFAFFSGTMPKSLSFTLMGHKYSRKFLEIVHLVGYILYRDGRINTPTMKNVFKQSRKANIDDWSMIKIMSQFYVLNSMRVVQTVVDTIKFLRSSPDKYISIYNSNPQNFIKEVLRLKTPVPFINSCLWIQAKNIQIKGKNYKFAALTPYQIELTMANHDPTVFGGMLESNQYSHEFDPTRNRLNETMTFRGTFDEITDNNVDRRPMKYCPGYQMIVNKFVPFLVNMFIQFDNDKNDIFKYVSDGTKEYQSRFDNRNYHYNHGTKYSDKTKSINEIVN